MWWQGMCHVSNLLPLTAPSETQNHKDSYLIVRVMVLLKSILLKAGVVFDVIHHPHLLICRDIVDVMVEHVS